VAYITIDPKRRNDILNLDWLSSDNLKQSGQYVDWYRFNQPFLATLNGMTGEGIIYQPKADTPEMMDEEESSGI